MHLQTLPSLLRIKVTWRKNKPNASFRSRYASPGHEVCLRGMALRPYRLGLGRSHLQRVDQSPPKSCLAHQPGTQTWKVERLTLCFWEKEVRHDGVTGIGSDVDEEVLPAKLVKPVWGDLSNDDVVQPIRCGRDSSTEGSLVHREDFRLVDP